jgi:hypothetical protein
MKVDYGGMEKKDRKERGEWKGEKEKGKWRKKERRKETK